MPRVVMIFIDLLLQTLRLQALFSHLPNRFRFLLHKSTSFRKSNPTPIGSSVLTVKAPPTEHLPLPKALSRNDCHSQVVHDLKHEIIITH